MICQTHDDELQCQDLYSIYLYSTLWSWCEHSETELKPFTLLPSSLLIMCDGDRLRH